MRDPNRIRYFCDRLAAAWELVPVISKMIR